MEAQEIFNTVATHLAQQGIKSIDGGQCLYRGPNGTKCAIGCLITDEIYTPDIEGSLVSSIIIYLPENVTKNIKLLYTLQNCHDLYKVVDWPFRLIEIAYSWKLDSSIIKEKFNV